MDKGGGMVHGQIVDRLTDDDKDEHLDFQIEATSYE